METVDGSPSRPQDDDSLLSQRSLLIVFMAMGIGLSSGLGSGFIAGIAVARVAGPAVGIVVGAASCLGASALAGLTAAKALHALVGRKSN
jgi:hypothetical protein